MENVQIEKKETEAQKRASRKYKNSKYRPNVFIDADKRESIERWFTGKGYKSFNEYVCALIDEDMRRDIPDNVKYSDQAASADDDKLPWEE